MAARIQKEFGVESELIQGKGGVFDVVVDGDMVFSKHEVGRFPTEQEVIDLMQ